MKIEALFLFLWGSSAANLQIDGEVSFDLKFSNHLDQSVVEGLHDSKDKNQVTAGPVVECIYQYPEQKQIDAILSNMMNMLTKVFVRALDYFTNGDRDGDGRRAEAKEDARHLVEADEDARHPAEAKKDARHPAEAEEAARHPVEAEENTRHPAETRFKIIDNKNTQFFEYIYHNMTDEFSKFYNNTVDRVDRSAQDPCQHQAEIKQIWRELIEHSLVTFRRAALRCVEEHLKVQKNDERVRYRLGQFLVRELAKVRSSQLHMLCDRFQLCYNELL